MDIEFVGKDQGLPQPQPLVHKPNTGQALDPVRVIIFGDQFGPLPHPAHLMEPTPHGLGRNHDPPLGL